MCCASKLKKVYKVIPLTPFEPQGFWTSNKSSEKIFGGTKHASYTEDVLAGTCWKIEVANLFFSIFLNSQPCPQKKAKELPCFSCFLPKPPRWMRDSSTFIVPKLQSNQSTLMARRIQVPLLGLGSVGDADVGVSLAWSFSLRWHINKRLHISIYTDNIHVFFHKRNGLCVFLQYMVPLSGSSKWMIIIDLWHVWCVIFFTLSPSKKDRLHFVTCQQNAGFKRDYHIPCSTSDPHVASVWLKVEALRQPKRQNHQCP